MTHVDKDFDRFINDIALYREKIAESEALGEEISQILKLKPALRTLKDRLRIKELRKKADELDSEIDRIAHLGPNTAQKLADKLHYDGCHLAHADQCTYYYERNWEQSDHAKYLSRANKIIENIGEEKVIEILGQFEDKRGISKEIERVTSIIKDLQNMVNDYK